MTNALRASACRNPSKAVILPGPPLLTCRPISSPMQTARKATIAKAARLSRSHQTRAAITRQSEAARRGTVSRSVSIIRSAHRKSFSSSNNIGCLMHHLAEWRRQPNAEQQQNSEHQSHRRHPVKQRGLLRARDLWSPQQNPGELIENSTEGGEQCSQYERADCSLTGREAAVQDCHFTEEQTEGWQPKRGRRCQSHANHRQRKHRGDAGTDQPHLQSMAVLVDVSSRKEKHWLGQRMIAHVQQRSKYGDGRVHPDAGTDKANVLQAGVRQEPFQVGLH